MFIWIRIFKCKSWLKSVCFLFDLFIYCYSLCSKTYLTRCIVVYVPDSMLLASPQRPDICLCLPCCTWIYTAVFISIFTYTSPPWNVTNRKSPWTLAEIAETKMAVYVCVHCMVVHVHINPIQTGSLVLLRLECVLIYLVYTFILFFICLNAEIEYREIWHNVYQINIKLSCIYL